MNNQPKKQTQEIPGPLVSRLQRIYGLLPLEDIVELIEKRHAFSVSGVSVKLDSHQLERLREQAAFYGKTTEEYIKEQVNEHLNQWLIGV